MSFEDFKKQKINLDAIVEKIENSGKKEYTQDSRFWIAPKNENGNIYAKIRFLPNKNVNELDWVMYYRHAFKFENRWFIENCPTSIKGKCPLCEDNKQYYVDGVPESKKSIASPRSRKATYVSNILVIDDPQHPENNGKVFLYNYGKDIYTKIVEKLKPSITGKKKINIFSFYEGCDFEIQTVSKVNPKTNTTYQDYSVSEWSSPTPLFGGDDTKLRVVYDSMYDLQEVFKSIEFKDVEYLQKRVRFVCYGDTNTDSVTKQETREIGHLESEMSKSSSIEPSIHFSEPSVNEPTDDTNFFAKFRD